MGSPLSDIWFCASCLFGLVAIATKLMKMAKISSSVSMKMVDQNLLCCWACFSWVGYSSGHTALKWRHTDVRVRRPHIASTSMWRQYGCVLLVTESQSPLFHIINTSRFIATAYALSNCFLITILPNCVENRTFLDLHAMFYWHIKLSNNLKKILLRGSLSY